MLSLSNYLLFSILLLSDSLSDPRADMMQFKEKRCLTMCENETFITTDTCEFTCVVYLEGFPGNSYATFLLREKTDRFAKEIFSLEPYSDCKRFMNKTAHECTALNDTVFSLSVRLNASIDYDEAEITCKLQIPGTNIISRKFQHFPKVFDSRNATWILKVNGNTIPSENCSTSISSMNLTLEFYCLSIARPCLISILVNETSHTVDGKDKVVFNTLLKEDVVVSIKFAACKLEKCYNYISCKIRPDTSLIKTSELIPANKKNLIVILVPSLCFATLILITTGIILFIRKKKKENKTLLSDEAKQFDLTSKLLKGNENENDQIMYETENGANDYKSLHNNCKKSHEEYSDLKKKNNFVINTKQKYFELDKLYDLIKSMVPLTVKITVKTDKTNDNVIKTGTGWVERVIRHHKKNNVPCVCNKCATKQKPSKEWRELFVYTSTHVVSNNDEAMRTTCIFFYDNENSNTFELSSFKKEKRFVDCQTFLMKYVTCDKNEVEKLDKVYADYNRWRDIHKKISERNRDEKQNQKIVCIVSHVHGGPKKISVGHWVERILNEKNKKDTIDEVTRYTYTASTCPGSAGAYVCILGKDHRMWTTHHLHCGVDAENKNFSTFAIDWA
ncbi:unnamed protein product [Lymnaea stagnalis]|uniref:Uncharacterized protein n=1 Tax=Lymnaea stagnalis TaxID=6523 RepID=A0AAV2H4B8_LYMST